MIRTGQREPTHTHRWPSVMLVDRPARIRYYAGNRLTYTSPEQPSHAPESGPRVSWPDPEGPHSVENIDEHRTAPSVSSSSRSEHNPPNTRTSLAKVRPPRWVPAPWSRNGHPPWPEAIAEHQPVEHQLVGGQRRASQGPEQLGVAEAWTLHTWQLLERSGACRVADQPLASLQKRWPALRREKSWRHRARRRSDAL
jgi:hypothetical protein